MAKSNKELEKEVLYLKQEISSMVLAHEQEKNKIREECLSTIAKIMDTFFMNDDDEDGDDD